MQSPPPMQTQEPKEDVDEGPMPPYDAETQLLIDGKFAYSTERICSFV